MQQLAMLTTTIRQFLDEGRMFTGYDVTVETREREKIQLRHRDIRADIHEIPVVLTAIDTGHESNGQTVQWHRTTVPHPSDSKPVILYHPDHADPATYIFRDTPTARAAKPTIVVPAAALNAPVPAALPAPNGDGSDGASDSGGKQGDGSYMTDYRRRLFVPTLFLNTINLGPNDNVRVLQDAKKIVLSKDEIAGLEEITSQVIERNGDIRISSGTLSRAGLNHTGKFSIQNVGSTVEITQV